MRPLPNRRTFVAALSAVALVAALATVASGSRSPVTRARLERALPPTFARLYLQQARLLGRRGLTVASLDAKASCDKGGPDKPDLGPGSDWICMMSWNDPNVPLPDGAAKFELNVHANGCYTAGGPSKYVGTLQIADARGRQVDNPVFEFDGCFDPGSSDAPTHVTLPKAPSTTPTQQRAQTARLTLPHGVFAADASGRLAPSVTCSDGKDGCAGTLTVRANGRTASTTYIVPTDTTQAVTLPVPRGTTGTVRLHADPVIGVAPRPDATVTVSR